MKTLDKLAIAEIGNREIGGNNRGPAVVRYQRATNLPPGPWPWCAAFVCAMVEKLFLQQDYPHMPPVARPTTARAFGLIDWAKRVGLPVRDENYDAKPGDIVVYDFSHCGIVTVGPHRGKFSAVEGNTNGRGDRESTTGDGVWEKLRDVSLVQAFIEMPR